jgi:hypothetical protein
VGKYLANKKKILKWISGKARASRENYKINDWLVFGHEIWLRRVTGVSYCRGPSKSRQIERVRQDFKMGLSDFHHALQIDWTS